MKVKDLILDIREKHFKFRRAHLHSINADFLSVHEKIDDKILAIEKSREEGSFLIKLSGIRKNHDLLFAELLDFSVTEKKLKGWNGSYKSNVYTLATSIGRGYYDEGGNELFFEADIKKLKKVGIL